MFARVRASSRSNKTNRRTCVEYFAAASYSRERVYPRRQGEGGGGARETSKLRLEVAKVFAPLKRAFRNACTTRFRSRERTRRVTRLRRGFIESLRALLTFKRAKPTIYIYIYTSSPDDEENKIILKDCIKIACYWAARTRARVHFAGSVDRPDRLCFSLLGRFVSGK